MKKVKHIRSTQFKCLYTIVMQTLHIFFILLELLLKCFDIKICIGSHRSHEVWLQSTRNRVLSDSGNVGDSCREYADILITTSLMTLDTHTYTTSDANVLLSNELRNQDEKLPFAIFHKNHYYICNDDRSISFDFFSMKEFLSDFFIECKYFLEEK